MRARTHALSGAVLWLAGAAVAVPEPSVAIAGAAVTAGAAIAPDLDHPWGTATRAWGPLTRKLGKLIGRLAGGHRQGTHSLLAVPIAGVVAWLALMLGGPVAAAVIALCAALTFVACGWLIPWQRSWLANLVVSVGLATAIVYGGVEISWLPLAVMLGWLAHVAGDVVTRTGCPLLAPFTRRRFRLTSTARTGGLWETVVLILLALALVVLIAGVVDVV